jgi:hypothetical protein
MRIQYNYLLLGPHWLASSDLWLNWLTVSSLHLRIAENIAILSNLSLEAGQHGSHRAQVECSHCNVACDLCGITKTTAMEYANDLSLALRQRRIIKYPNFEQETRKKKPCRVHIITTTCLSPKSEMQPINCCERRPLTP